MKEKDINQEKIQGKNKEKKKEEPKISGKTIIVNTIIGLIILTFILTGGSILGMSKFFKDMGKTKIMNEDGSFSIPADAQVPQNRENPDTYVGKVLNEKIKINQQDDFNYNIMRVFNLNDRNPYEKYQLARYFFNQAINKIIGKNNARKMDITISKDYLIQEVGKRYFVDEEGDINYYAMKKDPSKVNSLAEETMHNLLYENFVHDYFEGLPVSYDEMWANYRLENSKVSLKYIEILNNEVDTTTIKSFYENNKDNYKQYKLIRLVFKEREIAEEVLEELVNNSSEFTNIGNKLKEEEKIINIVYDSDYTFTNAFEDFELIDAVKKTKTNNVYNGVVETGVGSIIFYLDKVRYANMYDDNIYQKIKNDYITRNYENIEKKNEDLTDKIYQYAKRYGFNSASGKYNKNSKQIPSPISFMSRNIPNVNPDETDDRDFMVSIFNSKKKDILSPYKHGNGFMIVQITEKKDVKKEDFEALFYDLISKNSNQKSTSLQQDYYTKERKKYEIVDNFSYVFNPQVFMPQTEK